MKKTIYLLLAFAAVLVSCEKTEKEDVVIAVNGDYIGTLTVNSQETDYETDSVKVSFQPNEAGDSASITLYQVRFVPQMPVTIDITVPGISVENTENGALLSCVQSIPLAMGGEYPRYTVTGFQGEVKGEEITFSLVFGSYPTSYRGRLQEE